MSQATAPSLRIEREGGVATLTIDRPGRRNAVDVPMWRELTRMLEEMAQRPEDRVLVLTGAGGTFCAGGDLGGAAEGEGDASSGPDLGADAIAKIMRETVSAACLALHRLPVPSIAAVEGVAAGAGANLALGCDLVLAAESARFGQVFVRRGLSLDSGGSWLLPRRVGLHKAKELAFFGDWVGAGEALEIGLVNRVVPDGRAAEEARSWAERLARRSSAALALIKRGLDDSVRESFEEALEREAGDVARCVSTPEFAEAIRAFAGKRPRQEAG